MPRAAVRPAAPSDVDEIVRIQTVTWKTAYADLVPTEAIRLVEGPQAREAWLAAVTAGGPYHVFVATEGDWTVGFCAAAYYSGAGGMIAEISTLLVEPRWGRRGHGGRLLAHAAQALRSHGADTGQAWIPETDTASRSFYAHAGWYPDGAARRLNTGEGELREIRLRGPLDLELVSSEPDT